MRHVAAVPFALAALLFTGACAYDDAIGYAPTNYPQGYDSGMGSGLVSQPGDRFGGQNVASVAVFEAPLAPYGQWVNSRFGRGFRPDVPQGWRPYVNGQWGEDRLWVSADPWGWATDHYGRWGFDEQVGWIWVPGTEWAPSWVAFRDDPGQNVAGWAPIPPNVSYSVNLGFGAGWGYDNYSSWYAPSWVWVPRNYLYQPGFGGRVLPWSYGANYWGGSRWQSRPGYPRQGFGSSGYRPYPSGNWQGGGNYRRPAPNGQWQGRPPQAGQWSGTPRSDGQRGGGRDGGRGGVRTGDAGIPGFTAWQPTGGGTPTPRAIGDAAAPRPMPTRAAEPPAERAARPVYAERPAPPMRAERNDVARSTVDRSDVRPE